MVVKSGVNNMNVQNLRYHKFANCTYIFVALSRHCILRCNDTFQEAFFGTEILDRTKTQEGQTAFQAAADTELPEEATMGAEVKSTIDTSADNIVFQPAPASPRPPSPKPAPTLPPPASQDDSDKEPHLGASNFNIFAFVFKTVIVSYSRVFQRWISRR